MERLHGAPRRLEEGQNFYDQEPFERVVSNSVIRSKDISPDHLRRMISFMGTELNSKGYFPYSALLRNASRIVDINKDVIASEAAKIAGDLSVYPYWFRY